VSFTCDVHYFFHFRRLRARTGHLPPLPEPHSASYIAAGVGHRAHSYPPDELLDRIDQRRQVLDGELERRVLGLVPLLAEYDPVMADVLHYVCFDPATARVTFIKGGGHRHYPDWDAAAALIGYAGADADAKRRVCDWVDEGWNIIAAAIATADEITERRDEPGLLRARRRLQERGLV